LTLRVDTAWQSVCQASGKVLRSAQASRLQKAKAWWIFDPTVHRSYDERRKVDEEAGHPGRNWRWLMHDVNPELLYELRHNAQSSEPPARGSPRRPCDRAEAVRVGSLRARALCWQPSLRGSLTAAEIERVRAAARKSSRYGHRDDDPYWLSPRLASVRVVRSAMVAD
jgi:hypothetical protein